MKIRSGIMIIGQPFGGKTTACRMFAKALDMMAHQNGNEHTNGKVQLAGRLELQIKNSNLTNKSIDITQLLIQKA